MADYNHDETRRCWDCDNIYIPEDGPGNFVYCPPCKAKRAVKNLKEKLESEEFKELVKEAKRVLPGSKWYVRRQQRYSKNNR